MKITLTRTNSLRYPLRLTVVLGPDSEPQIFEGSFTFCAHIAAAWSHHYA